MEPLMQPRTMLQSNLIAFRHRLVSSERWVPFLFSLAAVGAGAPLRNTRHDAIYQSGLIVVGDVISGQAFNNGTVVDCTASVQKTRILKGSAVPSTNLSVHWQYSPGRAEPVNATNPLGTHHAIWFLKKSTGGNAFEAMWVELPQKPLGGYFMPVPAGEPGGVFAVSPTANYQRKLGAELGFAMETNGPHGRQSPRYRLPPG